VYSLLGQAELSFRYFEGPFLRLGHSYKYKPKEKLESTASTIPAEA